MGAAVRSITFDCHDPATLARFWSAVTGGRPADGPQGEQWSSVRLPDDHHPRTLTFIRVPESRTVKNRVHLDLQADTTLDEEIARITRLGATVLDDIRGPLGIGFAVLADPEGNEFCVESSHAEITAARSRPTPPPGG
ncbi:VOC family protein [Sphaerisporangium sp. NBC_01403]|uniref:VOC family protein n=1 Tax=Sphaerisporangium sp. NBC_01403 TaxID=2903599 RepID=UPI00324542DA